MYAALDISCGSFGRCSPSTATTAAIAHTLGLFFRRNHYGTPTTMYRMRVIGWDCYRMIRAGLG